MLLDATLDDVSPQPARQPDQFSNSQISSATAFLRPFFGLSTVRTRHFLQSIHTTLTHTHRTLHLRSHDANEPLLSHSDAAPISDSSPFDSTPVLEPAILPPSAMDRTSTCMQARERSPYLGPSSRCRGLCYRVTPPPVLSCHP